MAPCVFWKSWQLLKIFQKDKFIIQNEYFSFYVTLLLIKEACPENSPVF